MNLSRLAILCLLSTGILDNYLPDQGSQVEMSFGVVKPLSFLLLVLQVIGTVPGVMSWRKERRTRTDPTKDGAMKPIWLYALLVILAFLLSACGAPAATEAPASTEVPAVTEAPATEAPIEPPPETAVAATEPPIVTAEPTVTSVVLSLDEQLAQIDAAMKQTLAASIAYNKPESMIVNETVTIELLLNPSVSPQVLSTQVTQPGQVASASIQITPRMKAVLVADDDNAFVIKPIHDDLEQLIGSTDTTRWAWLVTARKGGTQHLTLTIYRLIQYKGQEYWREVETYKAEIAVKVTVSSWLESLDWKWIATAIIIPLLAAALRWLRTRWLNNRRKNENNV